MTSAFRWAENLIPLCQPAYSPELSPIELVWQFIKAQLKGERFATLLQLRERLTSLLAQITIERIISLSSYNFVLEGYSVQPQIKLVSVTCETRC